MTLSWWFLQKNSSAAFYTEQCISRLLSCNF